MISQAVNVYIGRMILHFDYIVLNGLDANKNIIMSFFKSSGNIQKKESGPYRGFAYWMLINDPINLVKTARANYWNLMELLQDSRRKSIFNTW